MSNDPCVDGDVAEWDESQLYQLAIDQRRKQLSLACSGLSNQGRVLDLEIGCGHGHFLTSYAKNNPQRYCLGIDISRDRIGRANRKRTRAGLGNLVFMQCDARDLLESLPRGCFFSRIFVLFPDPWPKRKHHKNRLIQDTFLSVLARVAAPFSVLYIRTDHKGYWEQIERVVAGNSLWEEKTDIYWPPIEETVFQNRAESYFSLCAERKLCK